jgi:SAM-dependent methyltransferase
MRIYMSDTLDHVGYYHIAYQRHTIMNPLSEDRLTFLGSCCELSSSSRVLDIGSGKGWASLLLAKEFGTRVVMIDNSTVWIGRSKELFAEHNMSDHAEFYCMDASDYVFGERTFDLIICLGTAAIYGSFAHAIRNLRRGVRPGGYVIIGEPTVEKHAPKDYVRYLNESGWVLCNAQTLLEDIRNNEYEMLYALRSTKAEWDAYMGLQWIEISNHAVLNPKDPIAQEYFAWMEDEQEVYLRYQRHFVDWNIFLLRRFR